MGEREAASAETCLRVSFGGMRVVDGWVVVGARCLCGDLAGEASLVVVRRAPLLVALLALFSLSYRLDETESKGSRALAGCLSRTQGRSDTSITGGRVLSLSRLKVDIPTNKHLKKAP